MLLSHVSQTGETLVPPDIDECMHTDSGNCCLDLQGSGYGKKLRKTAGL